MFKLFRTCLLILFIISTATVAYSESTWISKKSDKSKKVEKDEKTEKSSWIKKKQENKEEYKKEEKKITKEVKSWITKKTKDKYITSIDDLPNGAIYFTGSNSAKYLLFYGYVIPDETSKLIDGYYKTSKGHAYFDDGKTTCKIGSTVLEL